MRAPLPYSTTVSTGSDLSGAAISLTLAQAAQQHNHPYLVITPDINTANRLYHELAFFNPRLPILLFPDWETLPYDYCSPHHSIISERLHALYHLPQLTQGIVLVAVNTVLKKLPPCDHIQRNSFIVQQGQPLE